MTAFDSWNDKLQVYFDSDGTEVRLSIMDYDGMMEIDYTELPDIIGDLMDAYALRGGDVVQLMYEITKSRPGLDKALASVL